MTNNRIRLVLGNEARSGESAMEEISYKGYIIELQSQELQAGGWSPKAVVVLDSGGSLTTTPLYPTKDVKFSTRQEADQYAVKLAKVWIDERA